LRRPSRWQGARSTPSAFNDAEREPTE
jgi:hypothetical protein